MRQSDSLQIQVDKDPADTISIVEVNQQIFFSKQN
uniref:Uncharacterized protein n=1 Tax=Arundo donax TaxID=35708 RepID=A0A0A9GXZ1_ARUDO